MQFQIAPPLTDRQMDSIEHAALDILEKVGMQVPHHEALEILAGKPGVTVKGQVVSFDCSVVQDQIQSVQGYTGYDTHAMAGAYSYIYLDPATGQIRAPTTEDLITSIRQADAMGFGVCAPVVPLDVPGPKQELVMERLTHENARFSYGAGQSTTAAAAEAAIEMHAVVGRPFAAELWVNSPLKVDPKGLDILWQLRHRKPAVRVINVPVRGMTAPISLAGLMAQSTAECLGGITTLRLLGIASDLSYRIDAFWGYSADMRSGNVLISGPDYLRLMLLGIFLAKRHGIAVPAAKAFLTSAKEIGVQAGAEKAAQGLAAGLAGADVFAAAGTLSGDGIFSPIQMVVDREILSWIDAATAPIDFSEDDFLLDAIGEVGPGGTFLSHESTVSRFREVCWDPDIFSVNPLFSWMAEGMPSAIDKARDVLNGLALRDGPVVAPDVSKELLRIENHFAARL